MRRIWCLFVLVLFAGSAHSQGYIHIKATHRSHNTDKHGICWYCCAQTIGNHLGIIPLQDITTHVLSTGIGHKTGASEASINHWLTTFKLKAQSNKFGIKTPAAVSKLYAWLDKGLPVIVSYRHSTGSHAILLLRVSKVKERWRSTSGEDIFDKKVTYLDPDDNKIYSVNWAWFYKFWTGKAYTFDPADQDPTFIKAPELRAKRLTLSEVMTPSKKVVSSDVMARIPSLTPLEARYQAPPYYPHDLPFDANYPVNGEWYKTPSNQDIKDGVTRPSDVFFSNYAFYGHDYYSEYKEFKARRSGY